MITAGGDGLITILFWGVVFIVGAIASAAKKKREEREALETQEQLRRVDAAIRSARQRPQQAPAAPQFIEVATEPEAAFGVLPAAPQVLEVASPAFRPATFDSAPVSLPVGLPSAPEPPAPARPVARPRSPVAAKVDSGFEPPTMGELREAIVWREIFAPCKALRNRPW